MRCSIRNLPETTMTRLLPLPPAATATAIATADSAPAPVARARFAALMLAPVLALAATGALAKLPAPDAAQQARLAETRARAAWSDKVAAYQLCKAQDKVVARYQESMKASGKTVAPGTPGAPCADPGPFAMPTPADDPAKVAGGPATAPVGTPSDHKPAAAPAGQAVQSPRQSP
ncbi:hypothetical protein SAMN05216345_1011011 [Cupriavidus sp. YR651]|uniref:hypothetical protein n=1 Tax=Cupriavidus sp. YR651 TaxID=1855315 RepID=UPI000889DCAA|nr:hypothetical protein [Cupriavidus sp. YR651]SDC23091.1 hypothetical protein SAMN05216345_1011011 [Cupriavidus sp. YR651]